jgi:hypothetical protein
MLRIIKIKLPMIEVTYNPNYEYYRFLTYNTFLAYLVEELPEYYRLLVTSESSGVYEFEEKKTEVTIKRLTYA